MASHHDPQVEIERIARVFGVDRAMLESAFNRAASRREDEEAFLRVVREFRAMVAPPEPTD